jgi:carbamate kinase
MRIVLALRGNALLRRNVDEAAAAIADLAAEHEVVVTHGNGPQVGVLALALRNALPDRDVASVLIEVIVAADDLPSPEPSAIATIRSLRVLIESGALVICAGGVPVALNSMGALQEVEAAIDEDLTAALLARRLDADLLLILIDAQAGHAGAIRPKVEAAHRFAEATGRRAAIGALSDLARVARGESGTQVSANAVT